MKTTTASPSPSRPASPARTSRAARKRSTGRSRRISRRNTRSRATSSSAIVHRLDKPTSGVLLFARTSKAAARLARQFRDGTVEKVYWAVVEGDVKQPAGSLEDWLRKNEATGRVEVVAADADGARQALLHYRRRAAHGGLTWLEVRPQTGRTHQLRVQLAHHGHPIYGDAKYGAVHTFGGGHRPARPRPDVPAPGPLRADHADGRAAAAVARPLRLPVPRGASMSDAVLARDTRSDSGGREPSRAGHGPGGEPHQRLSRRFRRRLPQHRRDAASIVVRRDRLFHRPRRPACGETDGPLGALFLARALTPLGIRVALITDAFCKAALQAGLEACGLRDASRPGRSCRPPTQPWDVFLEPRAGEHFRTRHRLHAPDRAGAASARAIRPAIRIAFTACAASTYHCVTRAQPIASSKQAKKTSGMTDHRHRRRRQRDRHGQDSAGRDRAATSPTAASSPAASRRITSSSAA